MNRVSPARDGAAETGGAGQRLGLVLAGGAALCLVAAGALLWWMEGEAVFAGLVSSVLAWCM